MDISKIKIGNNPPKDVNVFIEIPMNSDPVKYEFDEESGCLHVDRISRTPMFYPCNYGFIPHTIGGDGDPLDVMVICRYPLIAATVINIRPIGVLFMEDDGGQDEKIIAVPSNRIYSQYENIHNVKELHSTITEEISFFFERYKDLLPGKWSKVGKFGDAAEAEIIIKKGIKAT